jgi:FKBP-type peptidyl-prolyl cis-trans isomerase (trigger factor)
LLDQIARQESLSVDEAEVEDLLQRLAASGGKTVSQVREFYRENNLMDALRQQLLHEKTMKMLIEQADLAPAPVKTFQESE